MTYRCDGCISHGIDSQTEIVDLSEAESQHEEAVNDETDAERPDYCYCNQISRITFKVRCGNDNDCYQETIMMIMRSCNKHS